MSEVTRILSAIDAGDPHAAAQLLPLSRFFAGLTQSETAMTLGLPQRTVARYSAYARAWLYEVLREQDASESEEK